MTIMINGTAILVLDSDTTTRQIGIGILRSVIPTTTDGPTTVGCSEIQTTTDMGTDGILTTTDTAMDTIRTDISADILSLFTRAIMAIRTMSEEPARREMQDTVAQLGTLVSEDM